MRSVVLGHVARPLSIVGLAMVVASGAVAADVTLPLPDDQQRSILALPTAMRRCVDAAQFGGDIEICKTVVQFSTQMAGAVQKQIDAAKAAESNPKEAAPKK